MIDISPLKNPERLLKLSHREVYIRLYVFEKILKHLSESKNHKRKNERKRIEIAFKYINEWIHLANRNYCKKWENK